MRVVNILLVPAGIIAYLVFSLGFVSSRLENVVCGAIEVNIKDSIRNSFISRADVIDVLLENDDRLLGYPLAGINTRKLESLLLVEPFIKTADIYKTVNGCLNVDILQREPVLRVINNQGKSYYLDSEGHILPVSEKFTSRVLVANGFISEPFLEGSTRSIFDADTPPGRRNAVIYDLFSIAAYIHKSPLWRAQIAQIYVDRSYQFELIPRVGAHIIYFGDATGYETKFSKLEAFYLYGLNSKGWNNYEKIDLKYENQVVCTKR